MHEHIAYQKVTSTQNETLPVNFKVSDEDKKNIFRYCPITSAVIKLLLNKSQNIYECLRFTKMRHFFLLFKKHKISIKLSIVVTSYLTSSYKRRAFFVAVSPTRRHETH